MAIGSGSNLLGVGLYTPSEAAYFARVHAATLSRWIHGNKTGAPVVHAQFEGDDDRIVTFLDFVQALAIRAIRRQHKVSLQKIRDAVEHARERYKIDYPFAVRHRTCLFRNEVHIEIDKWGPVQISGKGKDQVVSPEVAELYLERLTFDDHGLASEYVAFYDVKQARVLMNPGYRFGQPYIESCRYTVKALLDAHRSEGSIPAAAEAYGVKPDDVRLAIEYDDYLQGPMAA